MGMKEDDYEGKGPKGIGYKKLAALAVVILLIFSILFGLLWALYMSQYSTTTYPKNFEVDMELDPDHHPPDYENYTFEIHNFRFSVDVTEVTLKIRRSGDTVHTADFSDSRIIVLEKYGYDYGYYSKDRTVFLIAPSLRPPKEHRDIGSCKYLKIDRSLLREGDTLVFEFEKYGETRRGRYGAGALPPSLHASVDYKGALKNFNVTLRVE